MRHIQNPKLLQLIIFLLFLFSGIIIMDKYETEVKLSKTITILDAVQSENEELKAKINELEKQISNKKSDVK